ncbi:Zinc/iron permease [Trichoderma citrinoviride]|uniref:Zinc/iron permease n=1 Tax=Trichoderma citrinoviride TaxID=58853 RepID=A0A2T4B9Q0_9HYPO|nr:Zinc/iron permease [Trichoderma citrinoviride]PTB66060.1 Zinc/iron permease [Trichoderma citrinoviride]
MRDMDGAGEVMMARDTWASIPSHLLRAELQRRQDEGERPQCGGHNSGWYDTAAHVFALLLILVLSTLACGFPLLSRRATTGHRQKNIVFYCQHIGTGVLLATAFVHLLPTAFSSLTDPCLPYFFSKGYTPFPGLIAMVSAIVVVGVESYLTARGAGHSHSHAHDFWDEDEQDDAQELSATAVNGMAGRRGHVAGRRPADLSLNNLEASEGLIAGVSPLPGSSPAMQRRRSADLGDDDDDDDRDSDLDLDLAELDPVSAGGSGQNGAYSSLSRVKTNARGGGGGGGGGEASDGNHVQSPDEQKRRMLQCLLLEAGILFHSVFIGMAISVATGPAFVVFLVAISFHQSFEGMALGSRIAAIQFPKGSVRPWLMVLAYGTTTPIGQAIGLVLQRKWDPSSATGLVVVGTTNAISSGLLLYAGLVQLLAEDFLTEKSYRVLKGKRRVQAYFSVVAGAALMAAVGAFA